MNEKSRKVTYITIYILTAGILALVYIHNIPKIPTLFELPDESGYLWNAAYFLGIDWDDLGKDAFYGYGYSIFLIPLFKLCSSGIALIKGAYIVNIIFVLCMYIVFGMLLTNFFDRYSVWIPIISAISCATPYLFTSSYKVLCETCFTFFCALLILLFYKCIDTRKFQYYLLLVVVAAFIPFIHTRGIVCSAICCIFVLLDYILNKNISKRQILLISIIFIAACMIFYLIKKDNLDYRNSLRLATNYTEVSTNLITPNYIKARFLRIVNIGIINYICSFISRFFYAIRSTGGIVIFGILNVGYAIKKILGLRSKEISLCDKKEYSKNITILLIAANFLCAIFASVFNSIGNSFQYIYYGRYYEHTIPLMLCCSLYLVLSNQYITTYKRCAVVTIIVVLSGLISYFWVNSYLNKIQIGVDTARTAAFSSSIVKNTTYIDVIYYSCLVSVIIILICAITHNKYIKRIIFVIATILTLWDMDRICVETIQTTAASVIGDYEICSYVEENIGSEKIYAINDYSYIYPAVIHRIQVLIKNHRVNEISYVNDEDNVLEQIGNGDYVIAFRGNIVNFESRTDYIEIMKGTRFVLYKKQI